MSGAHSAVSTPKIVLDHMLCIYIYTYIYIYIHVCNELCLFSSFLYIVGCSFEDWWMEFTYNNYIVPNEYYYF